MTDQRTVAFIGLGNMGLPMVTRLIESGCSVRGFDVSTDAVARLEGLGGQGCASAAEAANGADVIILMLPNSAIVRSVVDELTAADAVSRDAVIVDMSSSEPSATRALAETLSGAGLRLVDAPVSGGVKGATNGTLTIMVGGTDDAVERVLPVLSTLGTPLRCGQVGSGHAIKALNNLLSATHLWATSEAMEAGAAFGLDPEVMLAVFNTSSGRSGSTENKWPNFVLPGTYDSGFALALMLKDVKIALGLADAAGTRTTLSEQAMRLWSEAAEQLPRDADHTEIARWVAASGTNQGGAHAAPDPLTGADHHAQTPEV